MLRKNMPGAEITLWSRLRRRQVLGQKFRRQFSVDQYVIDFYCPALKLAIEVDGESHTRSRLEYDIDRQRQIESYGIRFLRFTNADIVENLDAVLTKIYETIENLDQQSSQT